jgi:hypothetical protein
MPPWKMHLILSPHAAARPHLYRTKNTPHKTRLSMAQMHFLNIFFNTINFCRTLKHAWFSLTLKVADRLCLIIKKYERSRIDKPQIFPPVIFGRLEICRGTVAWDDYSIIQYASMTVENCAYFSVIRRYAMKQYKIYQVGDQRSFKYNILVILKT